MMAEHKCPHCGKPVAENALMGLCPDCLLKAGVPGASGTSAGDTTPFEPPTVTELAPRFPQLEIVELLGRGGMGAVYKARQKHLDRLVALKILPPGIGQDPSFAERFTREAQALARLAHPNIVTLYEFGQADGLFYFLMEFVDGVDLRQLLDAGKLAPKEALAIVPQICDALQFAHNRGIVHRDIKPANILLSKDGQVKITDFGVAKIVARPAAEGPAFGAPEPSSGLTGAGLAIGTPAYMAPEQVSHPQDVDHRADIYSLGVVFYQMLTGELPAGKFTPPSRKVQVDVRLDEVVLRALEQEPDRRYQQASQVKTDVETIAATPDSSRRRREESQVENKSQSLLTSSLTHETPRISRTALAGSIWSPFFFVALVLLLFVSIPVRVEGSHPPPGPSWWLLFLTVPVFLLGCSAPFGTTILGWIAVAQIRRSAGRIYGLGLALFDGLLFPLLALDALIIGLSIVVARLGAVLFASGYAQLPPIQLEEQLSQLRANALFFTALAVLVAVVIAAAVDYWIIRRAWHAVNRPLGSSSRSDLSAPAPPVQPDGSPRLSRTAIVGVLWLLVLPIGLGLNSIASIVNADLPLRSPWRWVTALPGWFLIILGQVGLLGTTILGWVAVAQIRRSAGRIYGLGLALFDGLFFPLLVLDALIFGTSVALSPVRSVLGVVLLTLLAAIPINWLIIRKTWRAVNQPREGATPSIDASALSPAPPLSSPEARESQPGCAWRAVLLTIAGHGALLLLFLAFITLVVPRYEQSFKEWGMALPLGTQLAIAFANFVRHYWFLLLPVLFPVVLALDAGLCFLLQHLGGRRWCRWWSAGVTVALGMVVALMVASLSAPSVVVEAPPGQDRAQLKPGVDPEVFTLELDLVQMQDAVSLLREKYARRVCIEDLDFDLVKDRISLKEALAQFEAEADTRTLSSKEQRLLELARQWRREGKSEDAAFDMAQHYTGRFAAQTFDQLLAEVTQGTPYAWRRIRDTFVVYPRERSLLDYSVSLNTEALTVEQAVQKILDQKPQGARIGRMQTYVGPARPGTDPMPWLKTRLPKLPVEKVTAMEALCLVTERANPDLVWHIEGFQGQRHLSLLLSQKAIMKAKTEAQAKEQGRTSRRDAEAATAQSAAQSVGERDVSFNPAPLLQSSPLHTFYKRFTAF